VITEKENSYRPETYWQPSDIALANICGDIRKATVLDAAADGTLDRLSPIFFAERLTKAQRKENPPFAYRPGASGETLPPYRRDEVEILRLTINARWRLVTAVRARPVDGAILLRAVHDLRGKYTLPKERFERPLTHAEAFDLLLNLRDTEQPERPVVETLWDGVARNHGLVLAIEHLKFTSLYYPDLAREYRERALAWALEHAPVYPVMRGLPWIDPVSSSAMSLIVAAARGDADVVQDMLDRGVPASITMPPAWEAIVNQPIARFSSNDYIGHRLLEALGLLPLPEVAGVSALHLAARNGREEVLRLLLQHGADPRIGDARRRKPADHAGRHGHAELADVLLEAAVAA
jgi:hypothetical protein